MNSEMNAGMNGEMEGETRLELTPGSVQEEVQIEGIREIRTDI